MHCPRHRPEQGDTQALIETEQRFRRFFENNGSVMLLVDPHSAVILDANPAAALFYGYSRKELAGMPIGQLNGMPSPEIFFDSKLVRNGERSFFTRVHRLASGELRNMELYASPVEVGGKTMTFSILHDVTDRKQAEFALRESEERYRLTFEQAPIGILHTSVDGRFLGSNARFAEIIGYEHEEIPTLSFQQVTLSEDLEASLGILQQLLSGAVAIPRWEKRYRRKDGTIIWAKLTSSAQRNSDGEILYIVTLVEDIHARKEAEERLARTKVALEVSEECYRTAFRTSVDAISISNYSEGRYLDANQSFLDLSGYERNEVIGRTTSELGIWVDQADRQRMMDQLRLNGACRNLEARFRKKNGDVVWGRVSASPLEIEGTSCLLSIARDITESKRAEEEIHKLAFYDPLTNLPNRRLFLDRLRHSLDSSNRTGRKRALLFIDLDNFKALNDTFGHELGDLLLREVARRLERCMRKADTLARLGGR